MLFGWGRETISRENEEREEGNIKGYEMSSWKDLAALDPFCTKPLRLECICLRKERRHQYQWKSMGVVGEYLWSEGFFKDRDELPTLETISFQVLSLYAENSMKSSWGAMRICIHKRLYWPSHVDQNTSQLFSYCTLVLRVLLANSSGRLWNGIQGLRPKRYQVWLLRGVYLAVVRLAAAWRGLEMKSYRRRRWMF